MEGRAKTLRRTRDRRDLRVQHHVREPFLADSRIAKNALKLRAERVDIEERSSEGE